MTITEKALMGAGAGLLIALMWASFKGSRNAGAAFGGAVVDMADGVVSGVVVGAGSLVGIPETSLTQCEQDKAAGRTWDASFSCPAGSFIKYVFS